MDKTKDWSAFERGIVVENCNVAVKNCKAAGFFTLNKKYWQSSMGCTSVTRLWHYDCYQYSTDAEAALVSKSKKRTNDFEWELMFRPVMWLKPGVQIESQLPCAPSPSHQWLSHESSDESLWLKSESQCSSPGPSAQVWVIGSPLTQNKVVNAVRYSVVARGI